MGSVAAGKVGIRTFLRATEGLREADGVAVLGTGNPLPEQIKPLTVMLGSVTIANADAGMGSRAETPTMSCWAQAFKPGGGEDALDAARAAAEELFTRVEASLRADPSAGGAVPPPGRIRVVGGGLEESPDNWQGTAGWRAERAFSLSWTSHQV